MDAAAVGAARNEGEYLASLPAAGFAVQVNQEYVAQIISLCRAVRDGIGMLELTGQQQTELLDHVARAERAVMSDPPDATTAEMQVRAIRYILVEVADGPISAFMADAAAQIIGDGVGRLFK